MLNIEKYREISPTAYADGLPRSQFMDFGIKAMWQPIPRIAGIAYTVKCYPGDNLMLHAAIYRAKPGSVIVVEAGNCDYAVSGGNVCAIAQKRGIAGLVVDGVIRDLEEVRAGKFPVFARGVGLPPRCRLFATLFASICFCLIHMAAAKILFAFFVYCWLSSSCFCWPAVHFWNCRFRSSGAVGRSPYVSDVIRPLPTTCFMFCMIAQGVEESRPAVVCLYIVLSISIYNDFNK